MDADGEANQLKQFFSWLSIFFKDQGLQFTRCGFKGGAYLGSHAIDTATGYWENPQHSASKPPRWLLRVVASDDHFVAEAPPGQILPYIGQANTSQGNTAGVAVRIQPLMAGGGDYSQDPNAEVIALFIFDGPVPAGTSSESFGFDPKTGVLTYQGKPLPYVFAGLLGLQQAHTALAGEVGLGLDYNALLDALAAAIHVAPQGGVAGQAPVYDLTSNDQVEALKADVAQAWSTVSGTAAALAEADEETVAVGGPPPHIPPIPDLLGMDSAVYRQINAALQSGKTHLMFYGPPGTGKTTLARWVATQLSPSRWTLITGSSDWGSQDVIGGYQPVGDGQIAFTPGVLLRAFDQPLIIDELNRCDIDKVIGPLFTVLSGQQTTLPYRYSVAEADDTFYTILPEPKAKPAPHEFAPGAAWRLIATINSIDKASLYQMSYALARRFAWIYVDAPADKAAFFRDLAQQTGQALEEGEPALAAFWTAVNAVRVIGPAPFVDMARLIEVLSPGAKLTGEITPEFQEAALDAFDMVLLPMLDGITLHEAGSLAVAAASALGLEGAQADRLHARLQSAAI